MKLASLKAGGRDGTPIMVNRTMSNYVSVSDIVSRTQEILENWETLCPKLEDIYKALNANDITGAKELDTRLLAAPLPRAYQWLDGSAYLSHVKRVRQARGAEMPESFLTDPLMYQGGSDYLLGPNDPISVADESWGVDFESEIAVITDDVPMAVSPETAGNHIKLILLVNDISLRNLIPNELAKGFGFLHGKPPTAFSPVAITPDELGEAWTNYTINRPLISYLNSEKFGNPIASEDMQFNFAELIAHAAKTRPLSAGTIIGSGTVSNEDISRGCSCLVERRVLEIIEKGEPSTAFLKYGDRIRIDMCDKNDNSIFGAIEQVVTPWKQ